MKVNRYTLRLVEIEQQTIFVEQEGLISPVGFQPHRYNERRRGLKACAGSRRKPVRALGQHLTPLVILSVSHACLLLTLAAYLSVGS